MKKIIFFILTLLSTHLAYNQCVSGGTAANPACGGSTTVANVGSKNFVTLTTTAGNSYCVELSAGNDSGNAYSLQYTSFTAAGASQNVEIYAGGGCNWYSTSRTSSTLTLREASPTNTTSTAAICEGSTKALSATVSCGSFTPTWSDNSATGSIAGTTYSTGNITANETVIVTAALGGCTSDISFIVYAQPTATNSTNTAAICENQTKTLAGSFTGTSGAGTESWSIIAGGGSIAGTTYTPANVTANTTVTVRYTVTNGSCSSSQDVSFTVNALPNVTNTTSTAAICENTTKTLVGAWTETGGAGTGIWSIQSGGGSIAGTTYTPANLTGNTTVTVRYTVTNGACSNFADATFTVNAMPNVTNTTSTAAICENTTKALVGAWTETGGAGTGVWSVQSGGGSIAGTDYTPANVTANTTVIVRYTVTNGTCSNFADVTFTVDALPNVVNSTPTTNMCENTTRTLSGTWSETGGAGTGAWSVQSGGGSIAGITYTPANVTANTTVVVRYTVTNGSCSAFQDATFVVEAMPTITSSGSSMCQGETRTLTSDVSGVTYSGTGVSGTTFTAPNPGGISANYFITVTNGNCSSQQLITVYGGASITSSSADMCQGQTRALTASLGGGIFSGTGVSGSTFTAPTPAGASQTYTISYTTFGSPCPPATQDIIVYANPTTANAGSNIEVCVNTPETLAANNPTIGTGAWTWSPSAPTYVGGTSASDYNAQVEFSTGGTYTGTWTISNGPCTASSDDLVVEVSSAANNAALVSGATATATVEVCVESGWTYYATPSNPDEYIFAIKKNGSSFTATVEIQDLSGVSTYSSVGGVGPDRGTFLIGRNWNVTINSGSVTTPVDIRYFVDPAEVQEAFDEASALLGTTFYANYMTPLTFFKTSGGAFSPGMMAGGNFTFTPAQTWTFGAPNPSSVAAASGTLSGVSYYELTGVTGFSGGTGGYSVSDNGASSLPVELLSWKAKAIDNNFIELTWSTATEINNEGFEILRSTNGVDFETITWVAGNGNATEQVDYVFKDTQVSGGVVYYYKLKQVDFNGESETFDIVSAKIGGDREISISNLVPNPSKDNVKVQAEIISFSNETLEVVIYNHVGVKVAQTKTNLFEGTNLIDISVDNLSSGTYFVNFEGSFGRETKKLVIVK
jgi:hypothetical protein